MKKSNSSTNGQSITQIIKNSQFQHRLKKQIDIKFNKRLRKDEINYSVQATHCKQSSLFFRNPLTKSSYSLNDSITHKNQLKDTLEPIKQAVKSMNSKQIIALSSRQKNIIFGQKISKVRGEETPRYVSEKDLKSISHKSSCQSIIFNRQNKFKLLLKQKKSSYKYSSERKVSRIDSKIGSLQKRKLFLKSLIPIEKEKHISSKASPKRLFSSIEEKQLKEKIIKMSNQLIQTVELYFNMYLHDNIVGAHLKHVQGYNSRINQIIMIDSNRAKRIISSSQVTPFFEAFRSDKKDDFLEQDMYLLNMLDAFIQKMQRRFKENLKNYNNHQVKRRMSQKQSLEKTILKYQKKMGRHQQIHQINHFIKNRLRFNQNRRQQYMQNLQKRGIILNLIERSRQIILRQNEDSIQKIL